MVRVKANFSSINLPTQTSFECISGKLECGQSCLNILNIYRPPAPATIFFYEFQGILSGMSSLPQDLALVGDFNKTRKCIRLYAVHHITLCIRIRLVSRNWLHWFQKLNLSFTFYIHICQKYLPKSPNPIDYSWHLGLLQTLYISGEYLA